MYLALYWWNTFVAPAHPRPAFDEGGGGYKERGRVINRSLPGGEVDSVTGKEVRQTYNPNVWLSLLYLLGTLGLQLPPLGELPDSEEVGRC